MVYVILGMHKSGTTVISQTLHYSGVYMGDFSESESYDEGNKYEMQEVLKINNKLLGAEKKLSILIKPSWKSDETIRQETRALVRRLDKQYSEWGIKDPRLSFTYSFWRSLLPQHKIIFVYRDFIEVVLHYKSWNPVLWNQVLNAWLTNNENIIGFLQSVKVKDRFVINYECFLNSSSEFQELERFTGKSLQDVRKQGLYRNSKSRYIIRSICIWLFIIFFKHRVFRIYRNIETLSNNLE